MKQRLSLWLPVLLWMGMIFYSSSQPYSKQDARPELEKYMNLAWVEKAFSAVKFTYAHYEISIAHMGAAGFVEFFIRKGAHFTVFLVLGLLLYRAFSHYTSRGRTALYAWLSAALYAAFDEVHQSFTGDRTPLWQDSVLDSVGALTGILFVYLWRRK